ncbi:hypothetical protein ITP53_28675 [Nonomuraea sp. K274]|uniref:Uncharacterized protein n=1 Tax=Nonomuraea cypriaca TaxID=1187855 RepID=A0A931F3D2_9ACTN|nr:hypothetical protein [Nonomuraea cypriaca]MBF8189638.1 hypothetical protein [Nonomuraea cypriaca]
MELLFGTEQHPAVRGRAVKVVVSGPDREIAWRTVHRLTAKVKVAGRVRVRQRARSTAVLQPAPDAGNGHRGKMRSLLCGRRSEKSYGVPLEY